MLRITPTLSLPDGDVAERFVPLAASRSRKRARESSGVELRLDILRTALPPDAKTRLLARHDRRVTAGGVLIVISRGQTSQQQNREAARVRLIGIIREAVSPAAERRPTAASVDLPHARKAGRSYAASSRAVKRGVS